MLLDTNFKVQIMTKMGSYGPLEILVIKNFKRN
jgi:hypothetical protein